MVYLRHKQIIANHLLLNTYFTLEHMSVKILISVI